MKTSRLSLNITQKIVHTAETQTSNGINTSAVQQINKQDKPRSQQVLDMAHCCYAGIPGISLKHLHSHIEVIFGNRKNF
jgi:hypothetical protein